MTRSHPHFSRTNAIAAAVACLLLATSAQAGVIADSNPTTGGAFAGECGTSGAAEACVGAWNLGNVDVQQVHADGTVFGSFSTTNGAYATMVAGDSFISSVKDAMGSVMAKVTGKVWPIGEPAGIKAVNSDTQTKNGKPQNCLINSSYLGADVSTSGLDAYLNSSAPEPVICSSGFQSHKRFKIAMQPASVDGVADGAASTKPIDMVFNVTDGGGLKPYQVFSKINNYTGKRLKGYKIVVGRGTGSGFQTASELGIAEKLHISLGKGEGYSSGSMGAPNGSDLFDGDGLATFSHGLFGAIDTNFPSNGFFDTRTAGFDVEQLCTSAAGTAPGTCPTGYTGPDGNATLMNSDTIQSTTVLASNYTSLFGDWLPSKWQPSGVFYDDDNDPSTDAVLKAWWNGSQWVGNNDGGSAPIPAATLDAWGKDKLYEVAKIEDVLNLGINYILKVEDDLDNDAMTNTSTFTVRIIPVVATNQDAPTFLAAEPASLTSPATTPAATYTGGGGCSAATGQQPIDPALPLLAALGLAGWALRRNVRGD
jgi:hypothetical protein